MNKTDELVLRAQAGNSDATEILLKQFGWREKGSLTGFLGKYEKLLRFGRLDLRDKDSRRFIQLYIKNASLRKGLVNHYQNYASAVAAQKAADYLQDAAKSIPRKDLRQELLLLLLECIESFQKQKEAITFEGYLYNSYRYKVYRYLKKECFRYDWLSYEERVPLEDSPTESTGLSAKEAWFDRFYASEEKEERLGIFWVSGRCHPDFKSLTRFERMILKDAYADGLSDKAIGQKYGYHLNTIFKARHRAINKLDAIRRKEGLLN